MAGNELASPKPIFWVASSRKDIREFPEQVRQAVGQALFDAQLGRKHPDAKPLRGFGGSGVLEVIEDYDGNTYRVVYTVTFPGAVYVLHAFQKKSKRGSKTGPRDVARIRSRLKEAERHYGRWKESQESDQKGED